MDYNDAVDESNEADNTLQRTLTFRQSDELNLAMVPLHIHDNGDHDTAVRVYQATNPAFPSLLWNILRFHPIPGSTGGTTTSR